MQTLQLVGSASLTKIGYFSEKVLKRLQGKRVQVAHTYYGVGLTKHCV